MPNDDKRPLGRILLQRKLVPRELQGALQEQSRPPVASPAASPDPPGARDAELDALAILADSTGTPGLDLRQIIIAIEHLAVVPREVAEALGILPVLLVENRLYLAMTDPRDKRAVDELEFVTGKTVVPFIAVRTTLLQTIAAAYDAQARGEHRYAGAHAPSEPSSR